MKCLNGLIAAFFHESHVSFRFLVYLYCFLVGSLVGEYQPVHTHTHTHTHTHSPEVTGL